MDRTSRHLHFQDDIKYFILNAVISKIFFNFSQRINLLPSSHDRFLGFVECVLLEKAFTPTFIACNPASTMKTACLLAIEEMLLHVVLSLLLHLGQDASSNTFLALEYERIKPSFQGFFGDGPFVRLPNDYQELSLCCLYYFSLLDVSLLTPVASSCLCHDLEPDILFRIIEVVNSAYKVGHAQTEDHIRFFITLLSHMKVTPGFHESFFLCNRMCKSIPLEKASSQLRVFTFVVTFNDGSLALR